jgi:DMSO/TMAO reductase YedYZ molybdopterin-dependent catalytic subunit
MRLLKSTAVVLAASAVVLAGCAPARLPETSTQAITASTENGESATNIVLLVDGLVNNPLRLGYHEVTGFPSVTMTAVLFCPGVFEDQPPRDWYGVPIPALLAAAGPEPLASRLKFYATDGYTTTLSIEKVTSTGAVLAYMVDGATLSQADGYPFRLVANDLIGDVWIGWVYRIEVS